MGMAIGIGLGMSFTGQSIGGTPFSAAGLPLFSAAVRNTQNGVSDTKILCVGDSTTFGQGAFAGGNGSNNKAGSYPTYLATYFYGGLSPKLQNFQGSGGNAPSIIAAYDPRITFDASTTMAGPADTLGGNGYSRSGVGGFMVFTPTTNVDAYEVFYNRYSGAGSLGLKVGAGSLVTLATGGTTGYLRTTVSGPLGLSALTLTEELGSSVTVIGARGYNSSIKEISIINAGNPGKKAGDIAVATNPYSPLNAIALHDPDLVIIDLGINDWNQVTPTTQVSFKASIQALIDASKAAGADVLLVVPVPSGTADGIANQGAFQTYIQDLGTLNTVPVVDMIARWGSYAAKNALGWYRDTLHPTSIGYADKALAISAALNGV